MNIEVNDRLMCNWGAMFPVEEMIVVEVNEDEIIAENEENIRRFAPGSIREMGWRSANGSPIGVFLMEEE